MKDGKKNVYATIAERLASLADQAAAKGSEEELVYAIQADYFRRAARAGERGQLIAWLNFCPAPELFWAMDIVPVHVEGTFRILTMGSSEDVCRYIDLAEQHIPDYVCSSDKATLGAALAGDIPLPDIIVHSSHPCDSALATFPSIAEYFNIPQFCIDVPYWSGKGPFPSVKLLMDFSDPNTVGTFLYHCHILKHEDMGMMGSIRVLPGALADGQKRTSNHNQ